MWTAPRSAADISHGAGGERVGCHYPKVWEATAPPHPLHSVPASATKKKTSCFGFSGVCTRFPILAVSLSPLFCLVWILKLLLFTWFQRSGKEISVGSLNVAETPQKVHKSFTKLARASAFYQSAGQSFGFLPKCLKTTSLLSCFIRRLCTALALILQQWPFEAADWHVFSVYFLIKKNHIH